jgi:hypothetical protein
MWSRLTAEVDAGSAKSRPEERNSTSGPNLNLRTLLQPSPSANVGVCPSTRCSGRARGSSCCSLASQSYAEGCVAMSRGFLVS